MTTRDAFFDLYSSTPDIGYYKIYSRPDWLTQSIEERRRKKEERRKELELMETLRGMITRWKSIQKELYILITAKPPPISVKHSKRRQHRKRKKQLRRNLKPPDDWVSKLCVGSLNTIELEECIERLQADILQQEKEINAIRTYQRELVKSTEDQVEELFDFISATL